MLGITRHSARALIVQHKLAGAQVPAIGAVNAASLYDTACTALAKAVRVDEVKAVHDVTAAIEAYARRAKNHQLIADALALREYAERKLGEKLIEAKQAGQIAEGRPKNCSAAEQFSRVTLDEAGIDRKLSSRAQKKAGIAAAAFDAMVERMRATVVAGKRFDVLAAASTQDKAARRAAREHELAQRIGAGNLELPQARYGVILADPEWRFEVYSRDSGLERCPDQHYPTSTTQDIAARPVGDIAADDCVLFLWATQAMLPDALAVMAAWGFAYKSQFVWRKIYPGNQVGMGHWSRSVHELLLVGTRGKVPAPAPGTQWISVIDAPIGAHSQKPDWQYELIEHYFPNLPKIELNARRARPGWAAWGLDAPVHDPVTGEVLEATE